MEAESIGKVLPRTLLPFAQRWADGAGLGLLAQLLGDEQFCVLLEKYGEELAARIARRRADPARRYGNGRGNGKPHPMRARRSSDDIEPDESESGESDPRESDLGGTELDGLRGRVCAMEERFEAQQAGLEILRSAIRPLALALGSCPECFAGVDGCPLCEGRGKVASHEPDLALLTKHVVEPLATRGVAISLKAAAGDRAGPAEPNKTMQRSKPCRKKK
jgi:hypothetical protein